MKKSRPQTNETKEKIRQSLLKYKPPFTKFCPICGNVVSFKSRHKLRRSERLNQMCINCRTDIQIKSNHFSLMGRTSVFVQSKTRRSKNEIHFAELCKTHFKNVEFNVPRFNGWDCDVILNDQRVAVMWNGKWHYEKITRKHSVNQVQNRDKIRLTEIVKCGYTPYIVRDDGRENREFVEVEFNKFKQFLETRLTNNFGMI